MIAPNATPLTQSPPARYYHLPVMSECDAECRLCATLGCLRPSRITTPELQRELDLAQTALKTAIIFPPNFLHHPEASQFVSEVTSRGLVAIVRLRPEQLILFSELIATLQYRSAEFEVIVSEPIAEPVLKPRRQVRAFPEFKTVFIPTRQYDVELLFDSIPLAWRRKIEVLSPLPSSQESALSPDELYLWLKSAKVAPYIEQDRRPLGYIPGSNLKNPNLFSFACSEPSAVVMSVIVMLNDRASVLKMLESLRTQTLPRAKFEILLVFDRVNDENVETLTSWAQQSGLNVRGFELARGWSEPATRKSQAWNLAATHANGASLLFVQGEAPFENDLLSACLGNLDASRVLKITNARNGVRMLATTLRHYFEMAGFAEGVQEPGFEIDFFLLKSESSGARAAELVFNNTSESRTAKTVFERKKEALSAQQVFACSLNPAVFENNYVLMGPAFYLRRTLSATRRTEPAT